MKRRIFLLSSLGALGGLVGWRFAQSSDESAIIKVLHKRLDYLQLDEDGVRRFARDLKRSRLISSARLRTIDAAGVLYSGVALSSHNTLDNSIRHGEDRVVTQYLVSSDFFKNGADDSRLVRYLAYYDPFIACSAPFARPMTG